MALIELTGIKKEFSSNGSEPLCILNDLALSITEGEALAIIGPSGSGKSTLLNILGALDRPTLGSVIFAGRDLAKMSSNELADLRNRQIGFIFQAHHLLPQCTVLENVLVPTLVCSDRALKKDAGNRAKELLRRVGLSDRLGHRPGQLSGGERQRAAVVRALINQPKLLLADEPTGALDGPTAESLSDLLLELNKETNVTLVTVTHDLGLAKRMGRVLGLKNGKLGVAG